MSVFFWKDCIFSTQPRMAIYPHLFPVLFLFFANRGPSPLFNNPPPGLQANNGCFSDCPPGLRQISVGVGQGGGVFWTGRVSPPPEPPSHSPRDPNSSPLAVGARASPLPRHRQYQSGVLHLLKPRAEHDSGQSCGWGQRTQQRVAPNFVKVLAILSPPKIAPSRIFDPFGLGAAERPHLLPQCHC